MTAISSMKCLNRESVDHTIRCLCNSDEALIRREGTGVTRALEGYLLLEASLAALANKAPDLDTAIVLNAVSLYNQGARFYGYEQFSRRADMK